MAEYERRDERLRRLVADLREAPALPGELPDDEAAIVRAALAGTSVHVIARDRGVSEAAVWEILGAAARLASGRAPARRVETGGLGSDTDPGVTGGYDETDYGEAGVEPPPAPAEAPPAGGKGPAPLTAARRDALVRAATAARARAYAPYSDFRVGAALLTSAGAIVAGCNVENASSGLTTCAERAAVCAAVAAGELGPPPGGPAIVAVAIVAAGAPPSPCGACRQVLHEFGPDCAVIMATPDGVRRETILAALLPEAFGRRAAGAP